jgi:hypothetical protein
VVSLFWTRHKFWIVAGLAAAFNAMAAGFSLTTFLKYVASHPGSLSFWFTYLRLGFPITNLSCGIWILYRTKKSYEALTKAMQARDAEIELERQHLVRLHERQVEQFARMEMMCRIERMQRVLDYPMTPDERTPEQRANATAKARVKLANVVKALKCKQVCIPGMGVEPSWAELSFELRTKDGTHFRVDASYIYRIGPIRHDVTCYQVSVPCPAEEKIATALLQLNRDPKIFDLLKNFHGRWVC